MKHWGFFVVLIVLLILVACSGLETAVPTPTFSPTLASTSTQPPLAQVPAMSTPVPSATLLPSATATTTATATPSATPSATPTASATSSPTVTVTAAVTVTNDAEDGAGETAVVSPLPPAPATLSLAELPAHVGEEVTVVAPIVAAASFSQGFKFTLDDGTGRVTLLLWHNVYDDAWDAPQLNVGATVRATGEVGQYDGEWQIAPDFGGDVKVVTAVGDTAPARPIGELSQHVGELAQITGAIVRLESTTSFVKIFVSDETGEIVVLVWRTVLDRIPNNIALGTAGTKVQVNGRIELYRSNLQLVPALPYDVVVLP